MKGHGYTVAPENRCPLRADAKIRIAGAGPFFGPGVARLMEYIDETGSVRLACQRMDMSYSKGWKLLGTAEQELGYRIVDRRQGGKNGGAASLTEQGRRMLERYRAYERDCKEAAAQIFRRYFQDNGKELEA